MKLNELRDLAHKMAKEKGWWDSGDRNPLEVHMLIVSEIAEASEEVRKGTEPIYMKSQVAEGGSLPNLDSLKPEGELIELADAIIRIADYCGRKGWDLEKAVELKMQYNATRPYKHGKKL